jgi:Cu-processing system permease protein
VIHEFFERARDRWVLTVSVLFGLLACGVSLYGRSTDVETSQLIGPSLVTLTSLFVPLVALILGHDAIVGERERNTLGLLLSLPVRRWEVVLAKYLGRLVALTIAISVGVAAAMALAPAGHARALGGLMGPALLLGAAFLSVGVAISAVTSRQLSAASAVVATWFLLVFLYDLGLLGLLVVTDGAVSQALIVALVELNPAGLFRLDMMNAFAGPDALANLGMTVAPTRGILATFVWVGWVTLPLLASSWVLVRGKAWT